MPNTNIHNLSQHLHMSALTHASTQTVWDLLADFGAIDFFNPNLSSSFLLSEENEEIGVGTLRQCNLTDGKNYIREKIIDWQPGQYYTIDIYEGTMPVDRSITTLGVKKAANGQSEIYMDFYYDPKFGLFGQVINALMMRFMFKHLLNKVVVGLKEKAEDATPMMRVAA